MTSQDRTSNH